MINTAGVFSAKIKELEKFRKTIFKPGQANGKRKDLERDD